MNVLLWFQRDLRVFDHPALSLAAGSGRLLPLYIAEPEQWVGPVASARQWAFVAEALADLREDLAGFGLPLVLRTGPAAEVLARLCRQHRITRIVSHTGTAEPWTEARNRRVRQWAQDAGIEWLELEQGRPGTPCLPAPDALRAVPGLVPGQIAHARGLRLPEDPCPHRQQGGRKRGLAVLDSFVARGGAGYRARMAGVLLAERAGSRLSPYLAHGCLSRREVHEATRGLKAFQAQLRPGDPGTTAQCADICLESRAPVATSAALNAVSAGETGLPYLDACLRYLAATGWLHAQGREMIAGFASVALGLGHENTGVFLARRFTDYDPGIHWPQMQLTGTRPTSFDPVKQGRKQDPAGLFIRRWLPQLASLPDEFLHTPWRWPGAQRILGRLYPEAIIDPATALAQAPQRARPHPKAPQTTRRHGAMASAQMCLDLG